MPQSIRSFTYAGQNQITAILIDTSQLTPFIWVAFKGSGGTTVLQKRSAFDPDELFSTINFSVNEITRMTQDNSFIYLAVDDSVNIGFRISKSVPLTNQTPLPIPAGVNEVPVDIGVDGSDLYFLLPGIVTGEIASIVVMSTSGVFDETFQLTSSGNDIFNAAGLTIDDIGDLWIVTNTAPVNLIRLFPDGGGSFNIQVDQIV